MKASELMIGDFLRYKQDFPFASLQGKIAKVCGVDGRVDVRTINDNKFHESEHPNWLEPIPITSEILEKNEWKWVERHSQWELVIDTMHIGWGFYKGCISVSDWDDNGDTQITSLRCEFIHQLQHALKLCGIEKEIVL